MSGEHIMDTTLSEVVIHLSESVDEATLDELEQGIRRDRGVISVGHQASRNHLLVVVYDSEVARASSFLHTIQERGLHAQLIGM
jgi:hypothetical protein